MTKVRRFVACFVVLLAVVARAETRRVLVPVVARSVPGAYESIWESHLTFHVSGTREQRLIAPIVCVIPECGPSVTANPGETREVVLQPQLGGIGIVGYTDATPAEMRFSFRIQDTSRQALTWGTAIPVVPETDFAASAVNLFPVPLSDRFRSMLRIYALDAPAGADVMVRTFAVDGLTKDALIAEQVVRLQPPASLASGVPQFKPWYAQISVEQLGSTTQSAIRIECTPLTSDLRIWAFVSITNDVTQHVTAVTP